MDAKQKRGEKERRKVFRLNYSRVVTLPKTFADFGETLTLRRISDRALLLERAGGGEDGGGETRKE